MCPQVGLVQEHLPAACPNADPNVNANANISTNANTNPDHNLTLTLSTTLTLTLTLMLTLTLTLGLTQRYDLCSHLSNLAIQKGARCLTFRPPSSSGLLAKKLQLLLRAPLRRVSEISFV